MLEEALQEGLMDLGKTIKEPSSEESVRENVDKGAMPIVTQGVSQRWRTKYLSEKGVGRTPLARLLNRVERISP